MNTQSGFTFVEIIISLVILAVGVMAAAQLQVASLRFNSQAEIVKQVTKVAQGELEWRRQTSLDMGQTDCQSFVPDSFSACRVEIMPCTILAGESAFTCASNVWPVAYEIIVSVTGPRAHSLELRSVYTGIYVSGGAGGVGEPWNFPTAPPSDDAGAPTLP